ncbi:MAG: GntR family transcriptional regulator [Rhodospirillales bacterium]|nr:GntR family transcriptional regulator [Rhodospirillales bacterium]MDE2574588.1 GntR family transcriptional regulator [Rhodospirillales bacterium]
MANSPRPPRAPSGGIARYLVVAQALQHAIEAGTYPVGSLIPTEMELAAHFAVSRQTVRQAIGHLRQQKLLSARKGVGTRVETAQPAVGYHHTLQSLSELFRYAEQNVFRVIRAERVIARGRLAGELACRAGRAWMRLDGPREVPGAAAPLGWLTVYIDERYADLVAEPRSHVSAIFSQIEQRYGEAIVEVSQEIEAVLLDAEAAERLMAAPGSAALLVIRRYYAAGRRLIELSRTLHPAARFRYAMTLRRQ